MRRVTQIAYKPLGRTESVYLPITVEQARTLYHRGMECFDTLADAQWWLIRQKKPGDSLTLASILEVGGFSLIGYANV